MSDINNGLNENIEENDNNTNVMFYQLIDTYVKNGEYNEIKQLIENASSDEKSENILDIISELIDKYMKEENYAKAEKIAINFPDSEQIQIRLIKIYRKQGKLVEAEKFAKMYPDDGQIQSQLIKLYMKQRKYDKAIKLATNFSNNEVIQSQLMTVYIKQKKYDEAIEIAKSYPNNEAIQNQLITVYIKQRKYDEAIEIAKKHPNYKAMQSQLITIYMRQGRLDEAIEIAKKHPNYETIQSQLITIYMKQGRFDKAIEIAKRYPNDEAIQNQINNIPNFNEDNIDLKEFPDEIKNIRSRLSLGDTSYNDIKVLDRNKDKIDSKDYELIKLAIYDRRGYKKQGIEDLKKSSVLDINIKKSLTSYLQRNKTFFDLEKWDCLIGWSSSLEEYQMLLKEELIEKENMKKIQENDSIKEGVSTASSISHTIKTSNEKINKPKKSRVQVIPKEVVKTSNPKYSKNKSLHKKKKMVSTTEDTVYNTLNKAYKEKVFELKIKYYIDMHNPEKRESAIYKYDRLEDILSSKSSQKNLELVLLMLVGDMKVNAEKEYPREYSKVLQRINKK